MKATRFLMMFVAAAAMLFASCDKDNNNDNNTPTEAAENTLVQNGTVYRYSSDGVLLNSFDAGICPGFMLFN